MKNIIFNPFFKDHKSPVGAVNNSDEVLITIKIINEYNIYQLRLIIKDDLNQIHQTLKVENVKTEEQYNYYQARFKIEKIGLYWYFFEFDDYYGTHYIGSNSNLDGVLTDYYPVSWQLLVHGSFTGSLNWYKGKIMYQIMVDRFFNVGGINKKENVFIHETWGGNPHYQKTSKMFMNSDFFGGNLKGIIEKLDYLKSLNIGVLYLNPIFEAASNHKYDTGNYMKIDSMFGNEEDFVNLCNEAKKRNIYIILDGVFNHTGADSLYFNKYKNYHELGAYQSKASKYYNWYIFYDYPDEYKCWWGVKSLPSVNQHNPHYLIFITGKYGVIDKWLTLGAKGFRLDVVDELNDHFIDLIHKRIKDNDPENIVIGEVWEDASMKTSYNQRRHYFNGKQLDTVMNYPLKNAIIDYLKHGNLIGLVNQMRHLINNYPKHVIDTLMNHLGTHDTIRLLTNFADANFDHLSLDEQANYKMDFKNFQKAVLKLKMATAIQYTMPGIPSLYYGDETGMEGYKDPFCRKPMNWDSINQDIYEWYQKLGKIRNESVFIDGIYEEEIIDNKVFAFSRNNSNIKIITIINNDDHDYIYSLLNGFDMIDEKVIKGKLIIPKCSAKIIKINI